jgi:hypothetical protein
MAASSTTTSRDKALLASAETKLGEPLESLPLPWPSAGISMREARRPHGHQCVICAEQYRCAGPDATGECSPLCGPCLWVELGAQLRIYQSMADAIVRRRIKLEHQVGAAKCRKAQTRRMSRLREGNVLAGLGRVMMKRDQPALNDDRDKQDLEFRIDSSNETEIV